MNNLNLEGLAPGLDEEPMQQEPYVAIKREPGVDPNEPSFSGFSFPQMKVGYEDEELDDEEDISGIYNELNNLENALSCVEGSQSVEDWPECSDTSVLLAINEAYIDLVATLTTKVEQMVALNRNKQAKLAMEIQAVKDAGNAQKKKVPVLMYLPPYFKDENMMCAPLSDEAKLKLKTTHYDPLMKEERKWSAADLKRLKTSVRSALLQIHLEPFYARRDTLNEKIRNSGQATDKSDISLWKNDLEVTKRKINFAGEMSEIDLVAIVDAKLIDWAKLANVDFKGLRTAQSLRLKWLNEVSPRWNSDPWTEAEIKKIKSVRESDRFGSWAVLADKLGTKRTPWQCFTKYKRDICTYTKEWTPEEDEKLITLCNMMQTNNTIQWDKVTYYMPGRNRQQVRTRYMRTLDKNVKHGRWSEQEDLLLLCAVNRFGAQDWSKIAKSVPGRTDTQCRERWVTCLDRRIAPKEWTLLEDEKLIFLISIFGRNQWVKCAQFLENRTNDHCRYRYQSLINTKIRLCTAKNISGTRHLAVTDFSARTTSKILRVNRIYRKYNNMMEAIEDLAEGEGMDRLMEVVNQKQFERDQSDKRPNNARKKLTEDEKRKAALGIKEIEERHRNGEGADIGALLGDIMVEQKDIVNRQRRSVRMREQKTEKMITMGGDPQRKGRKLRLPKALEESPAVAKAYEEIMNSDKTEEEKRVALHAIMMETVWRLDQHEWSGDFNRLWKESGATIAEEVARETLTALLPQQIQALRNGEELGTKDTLSMSYASADFNLLLHNTRPRLLREASAIFHRSHVGISHPTFNFEMEHAKFKVSDVLYMPLSEEVTGSDEYLALKALMHTALMEPMILEDACLTDAEVANDRKIDLDLRERELEEIGLIDGTLQRPVPVNFNNLMPGGPLVTAAPPPSPLPFAPVVDPYTNNHPATPPIALPPVSVFSTNHHQQIVASAPVEENGRRLLGAMAVCNPAFAQRAYHAAMDAILDGEEYDRLASTTPAEDANSTPTAPAMPVNPRRKSRNSGGRAIKWKSAIAEEFEEENAAAIEKEQGTPRSSHSFIRRTPSALDQSGVEESAPKADPVPAAFEEASSGWRRDTEASASAASEAQTPRVGRSVTRVARRTKVADGEDGALSKLEKKETAGESNREPCASAAEFKTPARSVTRVSRRTKDAVVGGDGSLNQSEKKESAEGPNRQPSAAAAEFKTPTIGRSVTRVSKKTKDAAGGGNGTLNQSAKKETAEAQNNATSTPEFKTPTRSVTRVSRRNKDSASGGQAVVNQVEKNEATAVEASAVASDVGRDPHGPASESNTPRVGRSATRVTKRAKVTAEGDGAPSKVEKKEAAPAEFKTPTRSVTRVSRRTKDAAPGGAALNQVAKKEATVPEEVGTVADTAEAKSPRVGRPATRVAKRARDSSSEVSVSPNTAKRSRRDSSQSVASDGAEDITGTPMRTRTRRTSSQSSEGTPTAEMKGTTAGGEHMKEGGAQPATATPERNIRVGRSVTRVSRRTATGTPVTSKRRDSGEDVVLNEGERKAAGQEGQEAARQSKGPDTPRAAKGSITRVLAQADGEGALRDDDAE